MDASAVNAGFGAAVTVGLMALGIPYPLLWGLLTAAFRFIPSVGIWLVAPIPVALAFITGTGFVPPVLVLGMYLVLELLTTILAEPRVSGQSVGLAPVPLLLAITFWTGLWGIVGLVLATPVTVCLAVLGRATSGSSASLAVAFSARGGFRAQPPGTTSGCSPGTGSRPGRW